MKAVAFVGFKKSGKTVVIEKVAKVLTERGYRVGIAKSMHANFDREGSDTWRFNQIADYVLVKANDTEALLFKNRDLNGFLSMMPDVDFLLLEGFKSIKHVPKIICARNKQDIEELYDELAIAVSGVFANEMEGEVRGLPIINALTKPEALADLIEKRGFILPNIDCHMCGFDCYNMAKLIVKGEKTLKDCVVLSSKPKVTVKIDGKVLPMKDWVQEMVEKTIRGLLSSMKGYREGRIEIKID
jgi:molybdopterin-guanine dinucleotide biosynthesis protein B